MSKNNKGSINIILDINLINNLYYSSLTGAFTDYGLADFFTGVDIIQELLADIITSKIKKDKIKVKELCSGTSLNRWKVIAKYVPEIDWYITLTDFSEKALPVIPGIDLPNNLHIRSEVYSLFQPSPELTEKDRYDLILTTYGFDSVWLPGDFHYKKRNNQWYKRNFSLNYKNNKLPDDFHDIVLGSEIDEAILTQFSLEQHDHRIDLTKEPFGDVIAEYYNNVENIDINFPGGLITKIIEVSERQLTREGKFISADICVPGKRSMHYPLMKRIMKTGKYALFKVEDYGITKFILEKQKYQADLLTLDGWMEHFDKKIPLNITDHAILVASRLR